MIEVADRGKTRQETQPRRNQKADTFDQGTNRDSDSRHGARRQRLSVTSPISSHHLRARPMAFGPMAFG